MAKQPTGFIRRGCMIKTIEITNFNLQTKIDATDKNVYIVPNGTGKLYTACIACLYW